jgi:hypothetical protein
MNCFEWLTRSSDYLDGTLTGSKKEDADTHLDSCSGCSEHYQHYRLILTSISSQPRSSLPIELRKAPFSATLPRLELSLNKSRWEQVPWYLRTAFEATGIVLLVLAGVSLGPKIRSVYEQKFEKNLSDFSQIFTESSQPETPLSRPNSSDSMNSIAVQRPSDEFGGEGEDEELSNIEEKSPNPGENPAESTDVKVGNSDIWRFILKTDSPQDVRPKITAMLKAFLSNSDSQQIEGINAPGGIQFDLLVPQGAVSKLKQQLFELAPPPPDGLADTPAGETFTWYKIKSKRKIESGKARVVIWISQI